MPSIPCLAYLHYIRAASLEGLLLHMYVRRIFINVFYFFFWLLAVSIGWFGFGFGEILVEERERERDSLDEAYYVCMYTAVRYCTCWKSTQVKAVWGLHRSGANLNIWGNPSLFPPTLKNDFILTHPSFFKSADSKYTLD